VFDETGMCQVKCDQAVHFIKRFPFAFRLTIQPQIRAACYEQTVLGASDANLQIAQFCSSPSRFGWLNYFETACSS